MLVYLRVCHQQDDQVLRVHRMSHAHQIWMTPVILHQVRIPSKVIKNNNRHLCGDLYAMFYKNINIKTFSCNNFCNTCNICHVTWYQSQGQRLPRAMNPMIGPFYDDQMVIFGQRYKQNAINVPGNESKLENVYMGIKIVKKCFFGHLSSFIF